MKNTAYNWFEILSDCISHPHCVVSKDSIHASAAVEDADSLAVGSEGAAQVRVKLVVAIYRNRTVYLK